MIEWNDFLIFDDCYARLYDFDVLPATIDRNQRQLPKHLLVLICFGTVSQSET
jgi:hypothetical protein